MYGTMKNYDYILAQSRKTDIDGWNNEMVEETIKHLGCLSDQELCDLLFEKEIQELGTINNFYLEENSEAFKISKMQNKLKTAILTAVPTIKLVEVMYSSDEKYKMANGKEDSIGFHQTFRCGYEQAREELRKRYTDCSIIEDAFKHTDYRNKEWVRWQEKKRKAAAKRYQNPYLKSLEEHEVFFTYEDFEHGLIAYDDVISIKGCRHFWDKGGKRLAAVYFILTDLCNVVPQYIGVGDEVVFAVAPDDYNLHKDFDNTPLLNKLYEIIDNEYQRNLVLGCLLIEKFVNLIDPKVHVKVRRYDKDYLVGRFVIENGFTSKLFIDVSLLSIIEQMTPEEKEQINSFLELAKNLLKPPAKVPF